MNGYIAMLNGKRAEIYADSLYSAKMKAISELKVRKNQEHMLIVMLAEVDGETVTHDGAEL